MSRNILSKRLREEVINMINFKLRKEQIEFLKEIYPNDKLVHRILNCEKYGFVYLLDWIHNRVST